MGEQATILVVDDEPNLRRTLTAILERGGYQVTSAGDGKEALQRLQEGTFDLVFLDLKLPDTKGLLLIPQIRTINPDLPVLILTANATLESAMEAVRQGARDYMLKPIDPPHILARVNEILTEQQEPQRRREIIFQVQDLLAELRQMDGLDAPPPSIPAVVPAVDPARFLKCGVLTVDLHTRHFMVESRFVPLPPTTFDYLVTLMRHSPQTLSFEALVKESQGYNLTRSEAREMARWRIHEIRKVLEPDPRHPRYIITVRDFGYRLVV
jgi:two-component system, OmpR family, alkaline phosphatase synthesis response regulator PhoP